MTLTRTTTNNQGQMLEVKNAESVHIQQLYFHGGGQKAGAVVFSGAINCSIRDCTIENAPLVQGIMLADENNVEPRNIRLQDNTITLVKHGIQLWRARECQISGNRVDREPTYTTIDGKEAPCNRFGAITLHSVSADAQDIQFVQNTIRTKGFPAIYTNDLDSSDCGVTIRENDISVLSDTEAFHITAQGIVLDHNLFRFTVANTSTNLFKNATNSLLTHNQFLYPAGKTTDYALHLYTDKPCSNVLIRENEFTGCGEWACKIEAYKSDPKTFQIEGNRFSTNPVRNGGVMITGSYGSKYINQPFHILLTPSSGTINLLNLPCFNANGANQAPNLVGYLDIVIAGVKKNMYNFQVYANRLVSRDGSGRPSGLLSEYTYYATFSGSSITLNSGANYSGSEVALHVVANTP